MRCLVLLFVVSVAAFGGGFSITIPQHVIAHPIRAYHSVPSDRRWLVIVDSALQDVNVVDYATTRRGAFPGTGGCELNPLLTKAPCQIDVPRFTGIKVVVLAFGAAQWAPIVARLPWAGDRYVRAMTVLDLSLMVPIAVADANNVVQLTK